MHIFIFTMFWCHTFLGSDKCLCVVYVFIEHTWGECQKLRWNGEIMGYETQWSWGILEYIVNILQGVSHKHHPYHISSGFIAHDC